MSLKTIIVDDEPLALDLVRGYVEQTPFLELVGAYSNAKEAFNAIETANIDLLFLDIQMPEITGLTLVKMLEKENAPKVIFTTAFDQYAIDGFRLNAVDYLLKPFDYDEFITATNKAKRLIDLERVRVANRQYDSNPPRSASDDEKSFFVKSDYKLVKIDVEKIVYIEGLKDYIKIFLADEPKAVITHISMKEMEKRLENQCFRRVHRSYIINLNFIKGIDRNLIILEGGEKIPMSDGYKQEFTETINKKIL